LSCLFFIISKRQILFEEVFESSSEETSIPYFMDAICSVKIVHKEKMHEVKAVAAPLDPCAHLSLQTISLQRWKGGVNSVC